LDDFEEALQNIDVFCRVLVGKIVTDDKVDSGKTVEPVEKLLYRKNVLHEKPESDSSIKHFISLPHLEDPLIDVLEENDHVEILLQERCRDKTLTVHTGIHGIEICRRECNTDPQGQEVCVDKCQKVELPVGQLRVENMNSRCNNNAVFEVNIPKR
jgi:hypothetical protein